MKPRFEVRYRWRTFSCSIYFILLELALEFVRKKGQVLVGEVVMVAGDYQEATKIFRKLYIEDDQWKK